LCKFVISQYYWYVLDLVHFDDMWCYFCCCSLAQNLFSVHYYLAIGYLILSANFTVHCRKDADISNTFAQKKLLLKCWWNWHLLSISPTVYKELLPKNYKAYLKVEKSWIKCFWYEKAARKMLMKLIPFWCQLGTRRSLKCKKDWRLVCFYGTFGICVCKSCAYSIDEINPWSSSTLILIPLFMKCLISSNSLSLVNKFAARTRSWVRNSGPSTTDPGETDPWIVQPNLNSLTRRSGAARGDSAVRPEE